MQITDPLGSKKKFSRNMFRDEIMFSVADFLDGLEMREEALDLHSLRWVITFCGVGLGRYWYKKGSLPFSGAGFSGRCCC